MSHNAQDNFFDTILPTPPQRHKDIFNRRLDDYLKSITCITQNPKRKEADLCLLILTVLNMMSADIYAGEMPQTLALTFKSPSSTGPVSRWSNLARKPDFVAEESSPDHLKELIEALRKSKKKIKWKLLAQCRSYEYIISTGKLEKQPEEEEEEKEEEEEEEEEESFASDSDIQLCTFAITVKQHRPDLRDIFCFSADFEGFKIGRFNACGFVESARQNWSTPDRLFQYVSALYTQTRESSIALGDRSRFWRLSLGGGNRYLLSPFFSNEGPGRMSMVFSACREKERIAGEKPGPLVVKLSWRNVKRKHEGDFLKYLHRDGYVAGAVRIEEYFDLEGYVEEVDGQIGRRLSGVMMKSTGEPLSQCKNIYHFLCVMYDLVQTLENCAKQDVISRDVSWFNVLCNPKHAHCTQPMWPGNGKSINEILGEQDTEYQCLLSDFDHGKILSEKRDGKPIERIGTPMFIPFEVAHDPEYSILWTPNFLLQKILCDLFSSQELVEKVGAPDLANKFPELAQKYCLDRAWQMPSTCEQTWEHLPRHEVDSVFWIIIWWLSRVYPLNGDKEINSRHSRYVDWVEHMLRHQIQGVDLRWGYRTANVMEFKKLLHPAFDFLADMIHSMARYLAGPWAYIDQEAEDVWPKTHAHTVMKMLLLKEIIKLKKDNNPLPVAEFPRPARPTKFPDIYWEKETSTTTSTDSGTTKEHPEFKQLTERDLPDSPSRQASSTEEDNRATEQVIGEAKMMREKLLKDRQFFAFTANQWRRRCFPRITLESSAAIEHRPNK